MNLMVKDIEVKSVLTKSNLPVADYSVNPYTGCAHACKYCYASFMKRFTNHPEPWGSFVDKALAGDPAPGKLRRQRTLYRLSLRPLSASGGDDPTHPSPAGANAGQRLHRQHCHQV